VLCAMIKVSSKIIRFRFQILNLALKHRWLILLLSRRFP